MMKDNKDRFEDACWEFNTEAKYNKSLGAKAFQDGLKISNSPFIYNSSDDVAHYWWVDGWLCAMWAMGV